MRHPFTRRLSDKRPLNRNYYDLFIGLGALLALAAPLAAAMLSCGRAQAQAAQAAAGTTVRSAVQPGATYLCTSDGCIPARLSLAAVAAVPAPQSPVPPGARTDCDLDGGPYPLRFDVRATDVPSGQLRWGPCKGIASTQCRDGLLNARGENRCITTEAELGWIGAWVEWAAYGCSPPADARPVEIESQYIDDIGVVPGLALELRCSSASACGLALPICAGGRPRPTPTPAASPQPTAAPTAPSPVVTPTPAPAPTPCAACPPPIVCETCEPPWVFRDDDGLPSGAAIRARLRAVRSSAPTELRIAWYPAALSATDEALHAGLGLLLGAARADSGGAPGKADPYAVPAPEVKAWATGLAARRFPAVSPLVDGVPARTICWTWLRLVELRRGLPARAAEGCGP